MVDNLISYWYAVPYYVTYIVLFIFALIESGWIKTKKRYPHLYSFAVGILLIFIGLRGYIYSDWISYLSLFESISNPKELLVSEAYLGHRYEPGFLIYTSFIKLICNNFHFYVFVSTLIDLMILSSVFKRYLKHPIWGFVCFFAISGVPMEFNTMRNVKAIILFLFSLKYIQGNNWFKYCLTNLLGVTFHTSALIYLPLYCILNKRLNKKVYWGIFIACSLIYLCQVPLSQEIFIKVGRFFGGQIASIFLVYLEGMVVYGYSVAFVERSITYLLMMFFFKDLINSKSTNILFINLFVVYFAAYTFLWDFSIMVGRIGGLFIVAYWFLLPLLLENVKCKKYLYGLLIYILLMSSFKIILRNNNIMARYDNLIWGIQGTKERRIIMDNALYKLDKTTE